MHLLLLIVIFTALGGVLSIFFAGIFLFLAKDLRDKILPHGISFAIGALLAVAFLDLIPHAFGEIKTEQFQFLSGTILAGILGFFILEKLLIWRHYHPSSHETFAEENIHYDSHNSVGKLIIIGDGIHNLVDGILIAAAFLTDVKLGIATSLAVAAHEIPQEVGDFAILLQSGYSRARALFYNVLASLTTIIGGVFAYYSLEGLHDILPFFLTLAASSFIYIAVADLIPTLHRKTDIKTTLQQIVLIFAGVLLISVLHLVDTVHTSPFS